MYIYRKSQFTPSFVVHYDLNFKQYWYFFLYTLFDPFPTTAWWQDKRKINVAFKLLFEYFAMWIIDN